jgi:TetR/AcrR family transcriptional regulator, regulator of cefoperazone and chloramphenicol sensitivity
MLAGERLFARKGVDRVRLREINELAGQRNSSALHYHFGSRDGLVLAILRRHEDEIDAEVARVLDQWERDGRDPGVRDIAGAVVRPLVSELPPPSGRAQPMTPQTKRVLDLYEARIAHLPQELRRERLVVYMLMLTAVLADRAQQLESKARPSLDHEQFVDHVLDMVEGIFTAPAGGDFDATLSERSLAGAVSRVD